MLNDLTSWLPQLASGLLVTVEATVIGVICASALGICLSAVRLTGNRPALVAVRIFVSIFRNSPLLVQLFFLFYMLPSVGISLGALASGIIGITLNEGSYIAEIIRGGAQSISAGEVQAARSLGLSKWNEIRLITLPRAVFASIPSLVGQWSILMKDTTLLSLVTVVELTYVANSLYASTFDPAALYVAALIYIAFFVVLQILGRLLERSVRVDR